MWPGFPYKNFDLIAAPEHDNKSEAKHKNLLTTIGTPHKLTDELLQKEHGKFAEQFSCLPDFKISIIIGGNCKGINFTEQHANEMVEKISQLARYFNAGLIISTSRRTPKEFEEILFNKLAEFPHYFYSFNDNVNSNVSNPYIAMLAHANLIIVTGDSMSMCSEVCFAGKPVFIYAPTDISNAKYKRLHQKLYDLNYAHNLMKFDSIENISLDENKKSNKLDAAADIVAKLLII